MNKILGIEKYREYQKKMEILKKKVSDVRSENDADLSILLVHNDEDKQKITKYFYLAIITVLLLTGLISIYLKIIEKSKYTLLCIPVLVIVLIVFWVLFEINKKEKKKILENKKEKEELENGIIQEYELTQEKIYQIVVYIITINDFYSCFIGLNEDELMNEWKKQTEKVIKIINYSINYNINIASYQQYLNQWLAKKEIYG